MRSVYRYMYSIGTEMLSYAGMHWHTSSEPRVPRATPLQLLLLRLALVSRKASICC